MVKVEKHLGNKLLFDTAFLQHFKLSLFQQQQQKRIFTSHVYPAFRQIFTNQSTANCFFFFF